MSLEEKLARQRNQSESPFTEEERIHIQRFRDSLNRTRPLERFPGVGARLPHFSLPRQDGTMVSLGEVVQRGPLGILFFRGSW